MYYELGKETKKHFLTDCCLDILESERMLKYVEEKLILEAIETSYENASAKVSYSVKLSKQTVKNKISKHNFNVIPYKIPNQKRKLKRIYIKVAEYHVTLHEVTHNSRLINPYTICGLYEGNIDYLLEYLLEYTENFYDYEYIDSIFVLRYCVNWIKTSI